MLRLFLEAPAVAAPGLDGWPQAAAVLNGATPYEGTALARVAPEILPPTERRRSSATTKLALRVARESRESGSPQDGELATLFASANGDTEILHQLCQSLAEAEPMVSPMRFHNSVHNAPAGYWSIASGSMEASTSIAAYDDSFAAGLLSAAVQASAEQRAVMLVTYDIPFPQPLAPCRPIVADCAVALRLTPQRSRHTLAECTLRFSAEAGEASAMAHPELEALRTGNPAARALPLLAALARQQEGLVVFDYQGGQSLLLELTPC